MVDRGGDMANLLASDVKLADTLKPVLSGYNRKAQGSLSDALGAGLGQAKTSSRASGRAFGNYTGQTLGRANTMASQNIENSLAGSLGATSLKDVMAEREFQKKMALAREIGDQMQPGQLEQILGLVGQGANAGMQGYGLYNSLQGPASSRPSFSTYPSNSRLDLPYSFGGY